MPCLSSSAKGIWAGVLAGVFFWLFSPCVQAGPFIQDPKKVPWHIFAKEVSYDRDRELYIAKDDVIITGGKTRLEADYVEFSNKTKDAFAQGNVVLISGQDSISCNAMQINLVTEQGLIDKGTIFIQKNHLYLNGENIKKTGEFSYSAEKGAITSCDGKSPDWKISGRNIRVTIEGYGYASHATLWAKKVPALYAPFLAFPAKTKRQTGLLVPNFSYSDRLGFEYEQPLFIALSRSTDATLYLDYLSDRGIKTAGEFRYVLDENSKGTMILDYLNDDKIDDGTSETEEYAFSSTSKRTNRDRYWFRMKSDQDLPAGFKAKLDLDIVSDADYLLEFKDGYTGYHTIHDYFDEEFGRDLDEYDDTTRENSLTISKSWDQYSLTFKTLWYDNVVARQNDTDDYTLQTLPSVEFDISKHALGDSRFYYSLDSEFRSFYRQDTISENRKRVNGQRLDIYPKLYYPLTIWKSFFFEPYVGARETIYYTDNYTDKSDDDDSIRSREYYELGAQLSTKISRVFNLNNGFAEKIRHEIAPSLEYQYIPYKKQDKLPYFDSLDSIDEENVITWTIANTFTSRKTVPGKNGQAGHSYKELAWIEFYQDYDINIEQDHEKGNGRPWSDIHMESEINPIPYLSLDTDIDWSPYTGHFTKIYSGATLKDNRGDTFTSRYRLKKTDDATVTLRTWYTRFYARLTRSIGAYLSFEQDLKERNTIETIAGFELDKSCWGLNLEYQESDGGSQKVLFLIILKGIGEFGQK